MSREEYGTLYIVGTPIGNLEDITLRALRILREVELIAAEDTRVSRKLLRHYKIETPVTSYHQYSKPEKTEQLLSRLKSGQNIALVSDAGMPGISDPGFRLIQAAISAGIPVVPVPGPTAFVSALVVSGLPTDRFVYEGFLPRAKGERIKFLQRIQSETRTIILYEAPHRLVKSLKDILNILGDRQMVVVRELTKKFEEVVRGKVSKVIERFQRKPPKGEITIILSGAEVQKEEKPTKGENSDIFQAVEKLINQGVPKKEAIKQVAALSGLPKREVYQVCLSGRMGKR